MNELKKDIFKKIYIRIIIIPLKSKTAMSQNAVDNL